MRLPRVRITARTTMVAVALIAVMLGGYEAWRRDQHRAEVRFYLQQADALEWYQRDYLARAEAIERGADVVRKPGVPQERAAWVAWARNAADGCASSASWLRHVAGLPLLLADPDLKRR